jgi:pentapeptide repeat protein
MRSGGAFPLWGGGADRDLLSDPKATMAMRISARLRELGDHLAQSFADNIILVLGVAVIALLLLAAGTWHWDYWAEQTVRNGVVVEIKIDRGRIIQQMGVLLLGVPALLFAIWRSWTAHRQAQAALEQSRIAAKNIELAERSQNVDRFVRAVGMLESERLAVRQAGIYAIHELVKADARNYVKVGQQLLNGFISDRGEEQKKNNIESSNDVSDAFKTFGQLHLLRQETGPPLDPLNEFDFFYARLKGIAFYRVSFKRVYFTSVKLHIVSFLDTDCENVQWFSSTLEAVAFQRCNCKGLKFHGGNSLDNASFEHSDATGIEFGSATVKQMMFDSCNISEAKFRDVTEVKFENCWAWKDQPPFADKGIIVAEYFDPGPSDLNRKSFQATRTYTRRPDNAHKVS